MNILASRQCATAQRPVMNLNTSTPRWLPSLLLPAVMGCFATHAAVVFQGHTHPTYIVTLRDNVKPEEFAAQYNCRQDNVKPEGVVGQNQYRLNCCYHYALTGFSADLDATQVQKIKADPCVLLVEEDGLIALEGLTPVPVVDPQEISAGLKRMGIDRFPMSRITGTERPLDVDVCIVDTGVDFNHPDLLIQPEQCKSFVEAGLNGDDWNGHGTHVAGIIAALDNGIGVVGAAHGVRLWAAQAIGIIQAYWT